MVKPPEAGTMEDPKNLEGSVGLSDRGFSSFDG